jgi:hypothetical protein
MIRNGRCRRAAAAALVAALCGARAIADDAGSGSAAQYAKTVSELNDLEKVSKEWKTEVRQWKADHKALRSIYGPILMDRVCEALASNSPAVCDAPTAAGPNGAGGPPTGLATSPTKDDGGCKTLFWRLSYSKLLITASDDPAGSRRACMAVATQSDEFKGNPLPPDIMCEFVVRHAIYRLPFAQALKTPGAQQVMNAKSSPDKARQYMQMLASRPDDEARFMQRERVLMGESPQNACGAPKQDLANPAKWTPSVSCEEARLYRNAYKARNGQLCDYSGVCRVLLGGGVSQCAMYGGAKKVQALMTTRSLLLQKLNVLLDRIKFAPQRIPAGSDVTDLKTKWSTLQARCKLAVVDVMTEDPTRLVDPVPARK